MPAGYDAQDEQRWVDEPGKRAGRTAFARDRARIVHSAAWRRLAAKTQVLMAGEADFPRTRMTHSLEVAQVGRELGAALGCDPDLVEAACLAHDLGHPPFGHNGEQALDEVCAGIGGFEGNAQTLRILTRLEAKAHGVPAGQAFPRPVGLNLTRAALDAACKYPWAAGTGRAKFGHYADEAEVFDWFRFGAPAGRLSVEAQVMDFADDVAYCVHDVEDGIHGGLVDLVALRDAAVQQDLVAVVTDQYAPAADPAELAEALRRLLATPSWPAGYSASLRDLAALKDMTSQLIGRFTTAAEAATLAGQPVALLARHRGQLHVPDSVRHEVAMLKGIAYLFVMRRRGSQDTYDRQRALLAELVQALAARAPDGLEPHFRAWWEQAGDDAGRLRVIVDQVASLTDLSVIAWHRRVVN